MKRILEVQKQIGTLSKNAKNPFFKSQYLDLTTLIESVTPLLNKQGLLLIQPIISSKVSSIIIDSENGKELISSYIELPDIKDPQKLGSAITYFRRYTLKSLLAIAEEDDDGNKASKPTPKEVKPTMQHNDFVVLLSEGNIKQLRQALTDYSFTDEDKETLTARGKELAKLK